MFTHRDYLYQVERHQDDIAYAERQRLAYEVGASGNGLPRINKYATMIRETVATWMQWMRTVGHGAHDISVRSS